MGVDAFRASLESLSVAAKQERARLNADKMRLQAAYSSTRRDTNAARASANQALLQPLIHKNSELRLRYADLVRNFNAAVTKAAAVLKSAGLTFQPLSGMGAAVIVVPVVAIAALGTAWAIYAIVHEQAGAQSRMIDVATATINNPNATEAERRAAWDILNKEAGKPDPGHDPLGLASLAPLMLLAAVIVIVPPLIQARRGAAA